MTPPIRHLLLFGLWTNLLEINFFDRLDIWNIIVCSTCQCVFFFIKKEYFNGLSPFSYLYTQPFKTSLLTMCKTRKQENGKIKKSKMNNFKCLCIKEDCIDKDGIRSCHSVLHISSLLRSLQKCLTISQYSIDVKMVAHRSWRYQLPN